MDEALLTVAGGIKGRAFFQFLFKQARYLQHNPNGSEVRPNEVYQEMIPYVSYFQSLGLLPIEDATTPSHQILTKNRISEIYEDLDSNQKRELLGKVVKYFVNTTHFFDETNWPTSSMSTWVPTTTIDAISTALVSVMNQRNKARTIDSSVSRDEILSLLGDAYKIACPGQGSMVPVDEYWKSQCAFAAFWYGEEMMVETMCSSELFPNLSPELLLSFKPQRSSHISIQPLPHLIYGGLIVAGLVVGTSLIYRAVKLVTEKNTKR